MHNRTLEKRPLPEDNCRLFILFGTDNIDYCRNHFCAVVDAAFLACTLVLSTVLLPNK